MNKQPCKGCRFLRLARKSRARTNFILHECGRDGRGLLVREVHIAAPEWCPGKDVDPRLVKTGQRL